MTIILEQHTTPETGIFEIRHTITIYISAEDARRKANRWVLDEVSCVMGAREPTLVVGEQAMWKVPVVLTATHVGTVGVAGYIDVDVETGEMNNSPANKEKILENARGLAETLPPYKPLSSDNIPDKHMVNLMDFPRIEPQGNPADIIAEVRKTQQNHDL